MSKFLLGNVRHQLDDKKRVRIPAKYRQALGDQPYIIPGRKECLLIVPEDKFEQIVSDVQTDGVYAATELNDLSTMIFAHGYAIEEDAQGRFVMSQVLCEKASIKKDVVFVGKGSYLEVWGAEIWDKDYSVLAPDNLRRMLDRLNKLGV